MTTISNNGSPPHSHAHSPSAGLMSLHLNAQRPHTCVLHLYVCVCVFSHSLSLSLSFLFSRCAASTHALLLLLTTRCASLPTNQCICLLHIHSTHCPISQSGTRRSFRSPRRDSLRDSLCVGSSPFPLPPPAWCLRVLSCCSVCCSVCWCHLGLFNASHPDLYPNTSSPLPPTASWVQHRPSLSSRAESRATLRGVSACFVIFFFWGGGGKKRKRVSLVCLFVGVVSFASCVRLS